MHVPFVARDCFARAHTHSGLACGSEPQWLYLHLPTVSGCPDGSTLLRAIAFPVIECNQNTSSQ